MESWIYLSSDMYVKPIDGGRDVYVIALNRERTGYECQIRSADGGVELIGTGGTPRRAAQLIVGWTPQSRKAHLQRSTA